MQAAATPGIMQLVVLFQALSGLNGGQVPIGMPPLPEKSVVSRVAPEECLLYMSMSGRATPEATSSNKTEQLLAQPQVQALIKSIDGIVNGAIEKNAPTPDEAENGRHVLALVKACLKHPWCAFVSDIKNVSDGPPSVKGGMLLYLGDETEAFKSHLDALLAQAKSGDIETVTIAGKEFSRAVDEQGTALTWGFQKGIFVAGLGEGSVEAMPGRIQSPTPGWLTEMKEQLDVERPAMVSYANLAALREILFKQLATDAPEESEKIKKGFEALGFNNLKSFKAISGMDQTGMIERTLIESDGPLSGLLAVLFGGKLKSDDLNGIPDNAVTAVAVKMNAGELFKTISDVADVFQPGTKAMIQQQGGGMVAMAGFQSIDEALATLGETWTFSNSSAAPASPANPAAPAASNAGAVITVDVKEDFAKVRQTLEGVLMMAGSQSENAPKLTKIKIADVEVSTAKMPANPMAPNPPQPFWCVKDNRLIVAFSKEGMEAALTPASSGSRVAQVAQVAKMLDSATPPAILLYSDTKKSMETVYPTLPTLLAATSQATAQMGVDLSKLELPDLSTLLPYAEPTVFSVAKTGDGIQLEQRATMPGLSSSTTAPIVVALVVPAVMAAREAAQRAAAESPAPVAPTMTIPAPAQ